MSPNKAIYAVADTHFSSTQALSLTARFGGRMYYCN